MSLVPEADGGAFPIPVTRKLVFRLVDDMVDSDPDLATPAALFKQLVTARVFPQFVTSFLNEQSAYVTWN